MKVRMLVQLTGTRDGEYWPAVGETVDLPTWEALRHVRNGSAEKAEPRPVKTAANKK